MYLAPLFPLSFYAVFFVHFFQFTSNYSSAFCSGVRTRCEDLSSVEVQCPISSYLSIQKLIVHNRDPRTGNSSLLNS